MKHHLVSQLCTCVMVLTSSVIASAAPQNDVVYKAFQCEIKSGQAAKVERSLKAMGAKKGAQQGEYIAPASLELYGLKPQKLSVTESDGASLDSYVAIFNNVPLADVAKAANLKPTTPFNRDTKFGRLSADVYDGGQVWLVCTPTS